MCRIFSCEQSLPEGFVSGTLEKEFRSATKKLGIPENNLIIFDYQVRIFDSKRQDILENLVKLNKSINPDLVFLPSRTDIHQDHQVISTEGIRVFKHASILGYEMPWNNFSFQAGCFIKLTENHLHSKIEALKEYKSQGHRRYLDKETITAMATYRGMQCNSHYAEAFEAVRLIF